MLVTECLKICICMYMYMYNMSAVVIGRGDISIEVGLQYSLASSPFLLFLIIEIMTSIKKEDKSPWS